MKKIIFMFVLLSSFSYGFDFKIKSELPVDVEKAIRTATSSSSDKKEEFKWYKDSYLDMIKRLDEAAIPAEDREYITKKLRKMYGANYPKQLSIVNEEIAEYQDLVARIRKEQVEIVQKQEEENSKNKIEIEDILSGDRTIPERFKESVRNNAKKEFPKDFSSQKAYIKGAIQAYLELNQMIKK